MRTAERMWRVGRDVAAVLPRTHAAFGPHEMPNLLSAKGIRRFGEVLLDESALTGFTVTASPPRAERSVASCEPAAAELGLLGVAGAHTDPDPLRVASIRRRRFGRQVYDQLRFRHEPRLPGTLAADGFGGAATAVAHLCRRGDEPRPVLVWVHGAGQGQPVDLVVSRARWLGDELGFDVALPVQPGCGVRRHEPPAFPTMDPLENIAATIRAVSEVRALVRWLRPRSSAVVVAGVSMGSPVAALVAALEPVDAVMATTPILGLNAMMAHHMRRWGPSVEDVRDLLDSAPARRAAAAIDHLGVTPCPPPERRLVVGARDDRMAGRDAAIALHDRWGGELYWHRGSHVGHLLAGGVRRTTAAFLRAVAEQTRKDVV